MPALVSSPATMPRIQPDSRITRTFNREKVTKVIWALHSTLANPATSPAAAREARKKLLQILMETKALGLSQRIVPPLLGSRVSSRWLERWENEGGAWLGHD